MYFIFTGYSFGLSLFPYHKHHQHVPKDGTDRCRQFLGVLVIIVLFAACLAYRAYRIRRRYRTAAQLAIARGEPVPTLGRDDYWGLAGLSAWTPEGLDRLGAGQALRPWWDPTSIGSKIKLKRPEIWDAETEKEPPFDSLMMASWSDSQVSLTLSISARSN